MARQIGTMAVIWALGSAAPGLAEPQYRAEDILLHFQREAGDRARTRDVPLTIPRTGGHGTRGLGGGSGRFDLSVSFQSGSDLLTGDAQDNLDQFARALIDPALSGLRFGVEGHTDAHGPADENLRLSDRRAAAVVRYLVARGIAGHRLEAQGYGETRPLDPDPFAARNRRVETRVLR